MTSVQNPASTPQNAINASQTSGAGSPAVTGSPASNFQAQAPRSYAHATKSSVSGPVANGSGAPLVVGGGGAAAQNGKREPVNSRQPSNMAAPAIANSSAPNGGPGPAEHTRKPSVTINASGASGQLPNGGPQTPAGQRPNINFGQINAGGSPAIANSTSYQSQPAHNTQQNSSLPPPPGDPRVTSPAASPTPIPQPATSGGRPPSIASQGNGLNFGSLGGGPGPETSSNQHMPGGPQPGMMPGQNNAHFRRASSQSYDHSQGMPMGPGGNRGGYMGRGNRGSYQQGYQHMPNSPRFQQSQPYPQRGGYGGVPPHFQSQIGPHPGSPHGPPRSPAPMGSQPGTPHSQPIPMHGQNPYQQNNYYASQLNQPPGQYGMPQNFDPSYGYYQQPYQMHPSYMPGTPSSPRNTSGFRPQPPPAHQQPPYAQGQYGHPPSHNMSRTSSQVSERPASALSSQHAQPPPATPATNHSVHGHSQSVSAAPSSNFKIPTRTNKSIVIKNADGEVVDFNNNKKTSPAPPSQSPAPSGTATPPPRTANASTPSNQHIRSDSQSGKSAADIRAEFQEKVKREQDKEPGIKEEEAPAIARSEEPTKPQEPAIVKSEPAEETAAPAAKKEETAKPVVDDAAVDVPAPREGSKADELKTAKQDAPVEAAPAKVDAEPEKPVTEPAGESEEERKKREDDEEFERMVAEMEAREKEEEERERAFKEKRDKEKAEQAAKDKTDKDNADERMKQAEREAEALEEAREAERAKAQEKTDDSEKNEGEKLFASLKKPTLGPGAETEAPARTPSPSTGPSTPIPEEAAKDGAAPKPRASGAKQKPAALKIETQKVVEPAAPTPGMQSLRSARVLNLQRESISYPAGIASPNPALNKSGQRGGAVYDKDFLMQFQDRFKEKPATDWDSKLKDTLGDPTDSSVPKSARTPGPRQTSHGQRPALAPMHQPMGSFSGAMGRTLPPGTTSADRFSAATQSGRAMSTNALASRFGQQGPGPFPMGGGMPGGRGPSLTGQRNPSKQNPSKGGHRQSAKEQAEQAKKMPLTAGADLKPLEVSGSGWKPQSVGRPSGMGSQPDPSGNMAPDMVQRKVKSNLNKMTPERFDKISDEILKIAAQSQRETDGRTLRQVIALLFEKACDEAHWASMYAKFASRMLTEMSPDVKDENIVDRSGHPVTGGALFRKYLLNRCQEEFERGWEVNLPLNDEGQQGEAVMLSDEYYKAAAAKRKGLGLVQFIGELYKLGMLSAKIMHTCVKKLLDFEGDPDEASIEGLTKLLRTVGSKLEDDAGHAGHQMVSAYFTRIEAIMNTKGLPSRMYFMLLDIKDLRTAGWNSKDDKGPKTIQEIREEAAAAQQKAELERAKHNQRGGGGGGRMPTGRGDARNFSGGPMPPPDYNRNTLGTDELRKLSARKAERANAGAGPSRSLGPSTMMGSRSSSGRGLGPPASLMSRTGSSTGSSPGGSGLHSRSTSMAKLDKKDDEPKTNVNAFSALASMESEADKTPASSPPMNKSQPAVSKKPDDKPSS